MCVILRPLEFASMKSYGVVAIATDDPSQDSGACARVAMTTTSAVTRCQTRQKGLTGSDIKVILLSSGVTHVTMKLSI